MSIALMHHCWHYNLSYLLSMNDDHCHAVQRVESQMLSYPASWWTARWVNWRQQPLMPCFAWLSRSKRGLEYWLYPNVQSIYYYPTDSNWAYVGLEAVNSSEVFFLFCLHLMLEFNSFSGILKLLFKSNFVFSISPALVLTLESTTYTQFSNLYPHKFTTRLYFDIPWSLCPVVAMLQFTSSYFNVTKLDPESLALICEWEINDC